MRGRGDPTMLRQGNRWVRASRTPDGPATLSLTFDEGTCSCETWGAGSGWAMEHVPHLLGAFDEPERFVSETQPMRDLSRRFAGLRFGATMLLTEVLVPTIIEQKVTGRQARASYRELVISTSEPAPGPFELMLPPDPMRLAEMAYHRFHPFGIEQRRADAIRVAASEAGRIDALASRTGADAMEWLKRLPGIGPWTAAETVRLAMGDPDAVSIGDFHLPNMVAWVLAGEPRADDRRMLELLEPYRGQRARAARFIELSGAKAPAFGPREPIRSIARI